MTLYERYQFGVTLLRLRCVILAWLLCALPLAQAGTIGFSISFTNDEIAIVNTGNEPAYQLSGWTLDLTGQWRKTEILDGNASYLAPGKKLKARRQAPSASTALGRADPLLLLLHDQAGSLITQLAWRQTPAMMTNPLPSHRQGSRLRIDAGTTGGPKIIATDAIAIPYDGIQRLARPVTQPTPPLKPQRHIWTTDAAPLWVETGAGQNGAWLVHEMATGELRMQIVPDGLPRGQEQVPKWLVWVRQYLMKLSGVLAGVGLLWVGGLQLIKRRLFHKTHS